MLILSRKILSSIALAADSPVAREHLKVYTLFLMHFGMFFP